MKKSPSQSRYHEYLKTDYWQQVTQAVKAKAGFRCQVCNSPHDLQAHHRSYDHRGRELEYIDDLTCLCRRCHGLFHSAGQSTHEQPKPKPPAQEELVEITFANHKRLKICKEPWHWMKDNGIDPRRSGWAKRAIGHFVPARWLRPE